MIAWAQEVLVQIALSLHDTSEISLRQHHASQPHAAWAGLDSTERERPSQPNRRLQIVVTSPGSGALSSPCSLILVGCRTDCDMPVHSMSSRERGVSETGVC